MVKNDDTHILWEIGFTNSISTVNNNVGISVILRGHDLNLYSCGDGLPVIAHPLLNQRASAIPDRGGSWWTIDFTWFCAAALVLYCYKGGK